MAKNEGKRHSIGLFLKGGLFKTKKDKSMAEGLTSHAENHSLTPIPQVDVDQAAEASQSLKTPISTVDDQETETQFDTETTAKKLEDGREDQYGLKQLWPKEETDLDATAPDIVAVHGIDGSAWETWEHENGVLWLRDLLPKHVLNSRIYSFGYQAAVAFTKGRGDVKSFARSLLEGLNAVRFNKRLEDRPVIFICHSMGGIIVKQASLCRLL